MLVFLLVIPFGRALLSQGSPLRVVQCTGLPGTSLLQMQCAQTAGMWGYSAITRPNCFNGLDLKSSKYGNGTNWAQMLVGFYVAEFQGMWGLCRKNRVTAWKRLGLFTSAEDADLHQPPCNSSLPTNDLDRSWCVPSLSLQLMKAGKDTLGKFPPAVNKPAHRRILLVPSIKSGMDQKTDQWAKCGHSTPSTLLCQTTDSLSQDHLEVCHPDILFWNNPAPPHPSCSLPQLGFWPAKCIICSWLCSCK